MTFGEISDPAVQGGSPQYFTGKMADARLYSRVLSGGEVSQLSSSGNTTATWTGATNTSFSNAGNWDIGAVPDAYTNIIVPATTSTNNRAPSLTVASGLANLSIQSGGSMSLAGSNLTVNDFGFLSNGGTLYLNGNETLTNFANDTGSGTVNYVGSGTYPGLAAGTSYENLVFSGTGSWTMPSNTTVTVNNNITIASGATLNGGNSTISLYGNWSNSGTFSANKSNLSLVWYNNHTISGNNIFYDLTDDTSWQNQALTFEAGKTQTISHSLNLQGSNDGSNTYPLTLQSSSPGTQWNINVPGSYTFNYLKVYDSDNTSSGKVLAAPHSLDEGNNTNWDLTSPIITGVGPSQYTDNDWVNDNTPTFAFTIETSVGIQAKYHIQVATNYNFTGPVIDYTSALADAGSTSFTVGQAAGTGSYTTGSSGQTLSENTTYFWRVDAISTGGLDSGYATQGSYGWPAFEVDTTNPGTPLADPVAGTYQTTSESVTLTATDNTNGSGVNAIRYTTNGTTPTSSSAVYDNDYPIGLSEGTTTIKAATFDNAGNESSVVTDQYILDVTAPGVPGSPTISTQGKDNTPTFTWSASTDNIGGAGLTNPAYTVRWSQSYTFASGVTTATTNSTSFTNGSALADGIWYYQVKASDAAGNDSDWSDSASVQIDTTAPNQPSTNPSGGTYKTTQSVTLSATDNSGGSGIDAIYYTTNGTAPTNGSTEYTGAISISSTTTLKAIAYDNAGSASTVTTQTYTIDGTAPSAPGSVAVTSVQTDNTPALSWSASTDNIGGTGLADPTYTVEWANSSDFSSNDTTDTTNSTSYTVGSSLTDGTWYFRVKATDNAGNDSDWSDTASILIDTETPNQPTANPSGGAYQTAQSVTLSATDRDGGSGIASIWYTTDGSTPVASGGTSTQYTSTPISVTGTETIKATSYDNAGNKSSVMSQTYTLDITAPNQPTADVAAGTYNSNKTITLTATDNGGGSGIDAIYYTLDGSTPDTGSASVNSGDTVTVTSNATLKAVAYDKADNHSTTLSVVYVIDKTAPNRPTADVPGGDYNTNQSVSLSATDNGGGSGINHIYYTTNGDTPTSSSAQYASAIAISSTTTLKAIAYDNATNTSSILTVTYTIDKTNPNAPGSPSATSPTNNSTPTWSWSAASDNDGGTGLNNPAYKVEWSTESNFADVSGATTDTTNSTSYTNGTALADGTWYFRVQSEDNAGNYSAWSTSGSVVVDTGAPSKPGTPSTTSPTVDTTPTWTWSASTDNIGGTGLDNPAYTVEWASSSDFSSNDATATTNSTSYTNGTALADGTWYFRVKASDNVGNDSDWSDTATVVVDTTAPNQPTANPSGGAYQTAQSVTLSATDKNGGSGIASIWYTTNGDSPVKNGSTSTVFSTPISVTGTETIKAVAYDNAGNESSAMSQTYTLDTTAPNQPIASVTAGTYNANQTVTLTATDNSGGSGIDAIYYTLDGSTPDTGSASVNSGDSVTVSSNATLKAVAYDKAANHSTTLSVAYVIDKTAPNRPMSDIAAGDYNANQTVTLSATDNGGGSGINHIYYTTDGSTPTSSSTTYSTPVAVSSTTTLKAIAYDNAGNASSVLSVSYVIDKTAPALSGAVSIANPTTDNTPTWTWSAASDAGGAGLSNPAYTVEWATHADFSGSTSATTNSASYTNATLADGTWYFRVKASDNADNDSAWITGSTLIDTTAPTLPVLTSTEGSPTNKTTIHFTWTTAVDAGVGTLASPAYVLQWCGNSGFTGCDSNTTATNSTSYAATLADGTWYARIKATDSLGNASSWSSPITILIDESVPTTPVASVDSGSYGSAQSVTLSSSDSGGSNLANIYYTTDGSTPTSSSTRYTGAISVSSDVTIKAIAYDNAGNASGVMSKTYIIDTTGPNTPTADPAGGAYSSTQSVTLSAQDNSGGSGAQTIYYTTDGSTPTSSSTRYTGAISVSSDVTIKAIAYDGVGNISAVMSQAYVVDGIAPATPTGNLASGTYPIAQALTLTSSDTGGSGLKGIYYTTNGSTPTSSSTKYTDAFVVAASETIKAIAYDNAGNASGILTSVYVIGTQQLLSSSRSGSGGGTSSSSGDSSASANPVVLNLPAGTQLTCHSMASEDELRNPDSNYTYPDGLANFCFTTSQKSNTVTLTFVSYLAPNQVVVRKYDPATKKYTTIPDAVITRTTQGGQPALQVSYVIVDNGPLDTDPALGSITDPVGIATKEQASAVKTVTSIIFRNRPTLWWWVITVTIAILALLINTRRRRTDDKASA
ncbi:MAG: chitobiase/beta-hexosaminidase C-terminal domain-containing protein [Candidatus Saccharibacteria bacterium]